MIAKYEYTINVSDSIIYIKNENKTKYSGKIVSELIKEHKLS
jgi:hypothetical protein